MSSSAALRGPMMPVGTRMRAYFAPVERNSQSPAVFDPALHGAFALNAPPSPWISAGTIVNFRRTPATQIHAVRGGAKGAVATQFRRDLDARVEFDFSDWGKLQMALAGGSQHINVLASDANATPSPSGGSALPAVAVLPGSTAQQLMIGVGAVDYFAVGDLIAVDADYQQQTGYVGAGIAAAYVKNAADVHHDVSYVRRVTFNVGRVAQKTASALMLAQALIGGAPPPNSGAQKVVAFLDREGGSFFQEWSALFLLEEESGGRICLYYPRLQPAMTQSAPEPAFELAQSLRGLGLHAAFVALPAVDWNDSEQVLCYRSYFPAPSAAVY